VTFKTSSNAKSKMQLGLRNSKLMQKLTKTKTKSKRSSETV